MAEPNRMFVLDPRRGYPYPYSSYKGRIGESHTTTWTLCSSR